MKLSDLAGATGARVEGEAEAEITGAAGLDLAGPGDVTFLANPRYTAQVRDTKAAAIYVGEKVEVETGAVLLRARDPYLAYTHALRVFHPEPDFEPFVHPAAVIDPTAVVDATAWIGACAVVGRDAVIGPRARLYPNVTIYDRARVGADSVLHSGVAVRENCEIGERVRVHNNAVIGSDGFGYAKTAEGRWLKIPQTGRVIVEDDAEIGAGTTIDSASVGETRIGRGVKIDNLVQIGHSCSVADDSLICAQVGLAGSSHIGRRVILAGQVGIAGHLKVGDDAVLTAKSATSHDVPPGKMISGIPAFDNRDWLRSIAAFRRLGEMQRALRSIAARLAKLESDERK